jgi:hypothetical protein
MSFDSCWCVLALPLPHGQFAILFLAAALSLLLPLRVPLPPAVLRAAAALSTFARGIASRCISSTGRSRCPAQQGARRLSQQCTWAQECSEELNRSNS